MRIQLGNPKSHIATYSLLIGPDPCSKSPCGSPPARGARSGLRSPPEGAADRQQATGSVQGVGGGVDRVGGVVDIRPQYSVAANSLLISLQ